MESTTQTLKDAVLFTATFKPLIGPASMAEIVRIASDYFLRVTPAPQEQLQRSGPSRVEAITETEARRLALEWGNSVEDVAEAI